MKTGVVHHIEINVSNLDRSVELWGWLLERLGYQQSEAWAGGKSWRLDSSHIILVQVQESHRYAGFHRRRIGLSHIAFALSSLDELNQFKNELQARNVPILYGDKYPNASGPKHVALYLEDPDRIKIELVVSGHLASAHAASPNP
jgi:catechol 2,3-dioxygenase-like lactoylglutathione lyase family enzyme